MKVLIIEDNRRVATALRDALRGAYIVDLEHTGQEALYNVNLLTYDVILLDLGLPDMDGREVYQQLRDRRVTAPILIISGDGAVKSKVTVLDMGADDYITKPFNSDELKARIRAALRKRVDRSGPTVLSVGALTLDPAGRTIRYGDRVIALRRKEFDLLEYMMRNPGRTLTRQMIVDHVWESSDGMWTNAVDVHIKYLRDKIDRPSRTNLIKTVHGVGYKLEVPVNEGLAANT